MTTFRALTTNVLVDIDERLAEAELARAVIAPYPSSIEAPTVVYRLEVGALYRDGDQLQVEDPHDLVPRFEMDLYEQVIARAAPGWLLHAAAIEIDGRALVLCGPSGAGKTTLTLALASRGFRLLTEEVVWIDQAGMVRGLPRPLHVPEDNAQRDRIPAHWRRLAYRIRGRSGGWHNNILAIPPADTICHEALPLGALVRIGHGADWQTHLRVSPHHVALQRLWDRSLRQDDAGLAAATAVLHRHSSYELFSTTEAEALALLAPLLADR